MSQTLTHKILSGHLVTGQMAVGGEIGVRIDQTLTQDATGTTAFLLFEAIGVPRVATELSVSYVDHNMAQFGPENHNDHLYLQSIAGKVGAYHSRPGNGICHQVHLERFARPGRTLLGSDSHTPTGGGMGMIAIGAGGLDVAVAMGGGAFYMACPKVIGVELRGRLPEWVSAKDIILRLLSILTTKGNVGCVVEYFGEGVAGLPVPARATCTNMGAELGVTCSIFPSDEVTRQFLAAQGREDQYVPLAADEGAKYDRVTKQLDAKRDAAVIENIRKYCTGVEVDGMAVSGMGVPPVSSPVNSACKQTEETHGRDAHATEISFDRVVINLDELEPLAAAPSSPDNIVRVADIAGQKIAQIGIGSCTNSSYWDLMTTAAMLKDHTVHPGVELAVAPGSRQVLSMIAANGALADLVAAGARIMESACGPCIGVGFSPADGAVSLRTFNRNFAGRSGTGGDKIFLVSPETAAASALAGEICDPREAARKYGIARPVIKPPGKFALDDGMLQQPLTPAQAAGAEVIRGSTIIKPPGGERPPVRLDGAVIIKVGDKITTDHIMPAGSMLKFRSNVPEYAKYVFNCFNEKGKPSFADRALAAKAGGQGGVIVAGESYGQGSSREHAALCPMYLGVRAVIARSIERIHQANLVNFGIVPLTLATAADYDRLEQGDRLVVEELAASLAAATALKVVNLTRGCEFTCQLNLAPRQRKILAAGGLLAYTREGGQ